VFPAKLHGMLFARYTMRGELRFELCDNLLTTTLIAQSICLDIFQEVPNDACRRRLGQGYPWYWSAFDNIISHQSQAAIIAGNTAVFAIR
jgi:hypothetical protein